MKAFLSAVACGALLLLLPGNAGAEGTFDQETCSLCHIRDSVFFQPGFLAPEALKEFGEERLCGSCHNGSVEDSRALLWRGEQHPTPPSAGGRRRECSVCHTPHGKGGWSVLAGTSASLKKGGNAPCTGCHAGRSARKGEIHSGRDGGTACRDCHQVHGGEGKALLRDSGAALCLRCHGDLDPARKGAHPLLPSPGDGRSGPGMPPCAACHPVHKEEEAGAPLARCPDCHAFAAGKGPAAGKRHAGEGKCTSCHTFHARSGDGGRAFRGKDLRFDVLCRNCHPSYWAGDVRSGRAVGTHPTQSPRIETGICANCHRLHDGAPGTPLLRSAKPYSCLDCHESQNTIREVGGVALAHPVFEKLGKGRLEGVAGDKGITVGPSGEIVCLTCHKVHRSSPNTPLLAPGAGSGESCFWCHGEKRRENHRAASREAKPDCGTCHVMHGRKAIGGDPWGTLCQGCHPRSAVHTAGSGDREVRRAENLPEFDARGRRSPYGAISCPTCHQPHGESRLAKRLRGIYRPNGFLCTACHGPQESVALTPHDLRGIVGNSVCEPCHVPHTGDPPWMWGMKRGNGERGEEACRACHGGKGSKGMATPVPEGGHPVNVMASRPVPGGYPLYGPEGAVARNGVVSCPTCHEVHGTGKMPTGAGVDKLLRSAEGSSPAVPGPSAMCGECHPGREVRHAEAACVTCHPPHKASKPADACSECHGAGQGALLERHRAAGSSCGSCHKVHGTAGAPVAREEACYACHPVRRKIAKTVHAETGATACDGCHPVHRDPPKSDAKPKLGEEIPLPDAPCLRCHREGGMAASPGRTSHPSRTREVPTSYGAKVTLETPITMLGRHKEGERPLFPLFDPSGKPALSGVMGCLTCHDPHAGGTRDGEPSANAYLRDPGFAFLADLCAPCHRGENADRVKSFHKVKREGR